jgi:excisionase family DNA binding protein
MKFYTAAEIASMYGVTVRTVRNWTKRQRIPFLKIGGRVRFPAVELEKWVTKNTR